MIFSSANNPLRFSTDSCCRELHATRQSCNHIALNRRISQTGAAQAALWLVLTNNAWLRVILCTLAPSPQRKRGDFAVEGRGGCIQAGQTENRVSRRLKGCLFHFSLLYFRSNFIFCLYYTWHLIQWMMTDKQLPSHYMTKLRSTLKHEALMDHLLFSFTDNIRCLLRTRNICKFNTFGLWKMSKRNFY